MLKKVCSFGEDKESINVKADYVIDKEIGGIMFLGTGLSTYNCYVPMQVATERIAWYQ